MNIPELLAPAGGARQFETAVRFGADAVYCGLKQLGLRAHSQNFTPEELGEAIGFAHAHAVKVFVTLNIFAYDSDLEEMDQAARMLATMGADGVIVADPGAVMTIQNAAPNLPIHLSTQANTLNSASARFWHQNGVKRIVLSRELSLEQIRQIRLNTPNSLELEAFVHGAVCMSYSGRCTLSKYLTGRDGNRGDCAQTCRWSFALQEQKRPGQYFPVDQSQGYTQIFSARDLNLIGRLPELCAAGLDSLKIEGRMKTEYYTATVVGAYRRALDAIKKDPSLMAPDAPLTRELTQELNKCSHRDSDTGFYFGHPEVAGGADRYTQTAEFVGFVREYQAESKSALVDLRGKLVVGDSLELMTPNGVRAFTLERIVLPDGTSRESYSVARALVRINMPFEAQPGDLLRGPCRNHDCE